MSVISKDSRNHKKLTLASILTAIGVLLSVVSFPIGIIRCYPFQHTINVISGIVLGPFWATSVAFSISLIRNLIGSGSLLAFPGSMLGAFFVGFAAKLIRPKYKIFSFLTEPIGSGLIGAWLASIIIAPLIDNELGFLLLSFSFLASSVPGSCLGAIVFYYLERNFIPNKKADKTKLLT